ncbi:Sterol desaturase family protein [Minicystis rosea]|nr:Sterol desaturase family protein [Minicystis rosea]
MLFDPIRAWFGWPGVYLALVVSGFSFYAVLSGASYLWFFVRRRDKYVPDYRPNPAEMKMAVKWAFYSIAGNALLMMPIEWLIANGKSKLYTGLGGYGLFYLAFTVLFELVFSETLVYWIHRGLHLRFFYRTLHVSHHQFRTPTPLASVAFNPLDSFAQALPHHLCAFLLPVNIWVYHGYVALVTVWAVLIHDRVCFVGHGFVNHTGCHTAHHWYNKFNYGQFFTFWDKLCNTYKDPRELPAQFFASMPGQKVPEARLAQAGSTAAE